MGAFVNRKANSSCIIDRVRCSDFWGMWTALAAIASSTFFVESLRQTIPDFLLFLLLTVAFHFGQRRKRAALRTESGNAS